MSIGSVVAGKTLGVLRLEDRGLGSAIAWLQAGSEIPLEIIDTNEIIGQNVAFEMVERAKGGRYPSISVYCDRISNTLHEKFRSFSGKARLILEIRVSKDRLEGVEQQLQWYAGALMRVLDTNRGDWGDGVYYAGGYEATFGSTKHGGKNFIQIGKITFELDVNLS